MLSPPPNHTCTVGGKAVKERIDYGDVSYTLSEWARQNNSVVQTASYLASREAARKISLEAAEKASLGHNRKDAVLSYSVTERP